MIRRGLQRLRRFFRRRERGQHRRPWFDIFETTDVRQATIPRKPVTGRPPWETAPIPAICLFPQTAAPALPTPAPGPGLLPIIREILGADSVDEYIERLFSADPLPAAA